MFKSYLLHILHNIIFHMHKILNVQRLRIHVQHYLTKVEFIALVGEAVVDKQGSIRFLPIFVENLLALFDCGTTLINECEVSFVVIHCG